MEFYVSRKLREILLLVISLLVFNTAKAIELMQIPLEDGGNILYEIETTKNCAFVVDQKIKITSYEKSGREKLDFFEKLYFEVDEVVITSHTVKLQIKAASNMVFEIENKDCKLKKEVIIENKRILFNRINVHYKSALGAPVLADLSFCQQNNQCTKIYPYELKGHLPIYELDAGVGVSIRNNLRPGNESAFLKNNPILEPMPVFLLRYGNFFLDKDGLGTALATYKGALLLGTLRYDGEKFKSKTYDERKKGIFIGGIFKWNFLQVQYMNDYIDHKRGEEVKIILEHEFRPWNNIILKPRVYAQFWNKSYNDYYFGVKPHEDSANVYTPKSSINWSAMGRVQIHDQRLTYVADFGVKFLGSEVYRSPIITKKSELRMVLGILYKVF